GGEQISAIGRGICVLLGISLEDTQKELEHGKFGAYMQVHIQNDGPVTIELESPAPGTATSDPKQLSKLEKQQQRKEKTRAKGPSESSKERNTPRKEDRSASSGAEGDVSSEREP
uniref:D-aminoacyl-tRNA deacylase n=1 Tax=Colobus angolensis palliatus TaxID=336983 RepID=A0A2K5IJR7_COLAP